MIYCCFGRSAKAKLELGMWIAEQPLTVFLLAVLFAADKLKLDRRKIQYEKGACFGKTSLAVPCRIKLLFAVRLK